MEQDYLVVLVTTTDEAEARRVASTLLEQKLIACANLIPVQSLFMWEGKVQDEAEVLMVIKTRSDVFQDKLIAAIKASHSYEVPEIIATPIVLGSTDYLKWISEVVAGE